MKAKNVEISHKKTASYLWKKDFKKNGTLYLMVLPVIAFYILFCYKPMYGALIAFQDFNPRLGFSGSEWVGFKHFESFFSSPDFAKILGNTLKISLATLVFGFPAPIIFALMMNEVTCSGYKRAVQTASYLPHFISMVVICGMIKDFVADDGIIGIFIAKITGQEPANLLLNAKAFLPIYVISDIWQGVGWGSIVYLAALSAISQDQYEAADIDGAGKLKKIWYITLPSIKPTIVTMLILRMGSIMNVGFEKIILLYNPLIFDTSDVISSYVYRYGFQTQDWSYSTAVGLFNSVINFALVLGANKISQKLTGSGLW